jgi:hypothetical protein
MWRTLLVTANLGYDNNFCPYFSQQTENISELFVIFKKQMSQ